MKPIRLSMPYAALVAALIGAPSIGAEEGAAYSGGASALEMPDISVIVDAQLDWTDPEDPDRHQKLRLKEAELALSSYLYPTIRGDFIVAFEQEYIDNEVESEVHVEEAYVTFLELPGGLQSKVGRSFIGFGRLNTIHPHHWAFSETPLMLDNLFGNHPWLDDGLVVDALIPNPWDAYVKVSVGAWNGRSLSHSHGEDEHADEDHAEEDDHEDEHAHEDEHEDDHDAEHEDEHEEEYAHDHGELVTWDDHVYTGRVFADLPVGDQTALQLGYSLAADEGGRNLLQGGDLVVLYQKPNSRRKIKWHSEVFSLDDDERKSTASGLFSVLTYAPDKYWEIGVKYDFAEDLDLDDVDRWAGSGFVTRYLTHTTYVRGGYQYIETSGIDVEPEHLVSLQLVWGIGPHAHRLSD